ncbi:MAG: metallophosphoesterase, partial [Terriglobales bacterium]
MGFDSAFLRELPTVIFLGAGLSSQIYLVRRLHLGPVVHGGLLAFEVFLLIVSQQSLFPLLSRFFPFGYTHIFAGGALLFWSWILTAVAIALWLTSRRSKKSFQPERRAWLKASTAALCAAPVVALSAGIVTRKNFDVREVDLKFPNLPKDLRGLRLLQISDIHMGDFFSAKDLARAVGAANELRADVAFVTGDLITSQWDPLDACLRELAKLRASSGVWGCLGNHEMHARVEGYTAAKALEFDMRFLRHRAAPLTFGQSRINLVGVDHQRRERPYL